MEFALEDPRTRDVIERIHALSRDLLLVQQLKAPSIRDIASAPALEGWHHCLRTEPALRGTVTGHPVLGHRPIVTSGFYLLDPIAGYARTLSRWYRLGEPG